MRTKKFAVIIVAIVFVLVVLFSCIALFAVKEVNVNYAVDSSSDTQKMQDELDEFLGKNLMFLDEQDVVDSLSDFYNMEVVSVSKNYPNVLEVEIKERVEVYEIVSGETVYVTTDNGYVLRTYNISEQNQSRDKIRLELKGLNVKDASLGQVISTDDNELLCQVFKIAKSVQLTNCVSDITIDKTNIALPTAIFQTYTGVKILIQNVFEHGENRAEIAFNKVYEELDDFKKTYGYIVTTPNENADFGVDIKWTENPSGTNNQTV